MRRGCSRSAPAARTTPPSCASSMTITAAPFARPISKRSRAGRERSGIPVAAAGADEQAERQIHRDDLADAIEVGAGGGPVRRRNRALELEPRPVEQPEKQ